MSGAGFRAVFFTVPGAPVPKGRPRFTRNGHTYTDAKTKVYEERVRLAYAGQVHDTLPHHGPVRLTLNVRFPRPKSHLRNSGTMLSAVGERRWKLPADLDNVAKAIGDALNGVAYADDDQVIGIEVRGSWEIGPGGVDVGLDLVDSLAVA